MNATDDEKIALFDIKLTTPPMDQQEFAQAPVVLIRHGLSEFNLRHLEAVHLHGKGSGGVRAIETDTEGADPGLHPIGVRQCEAHHDVINGIEWKVVFSSPMKRAMMTTVHMFKNHPNKDKMQFIVLPIAREVLHTTCDIAMDPEELVKLYGPGQPEACGITFDFSRLFLYGLPQLWQIYTFAHAGKQKEVIMQLEKVNPEEDHLAPQKVNYKEVMCKVLPQHEPRFEDVDSLLRRADVFRDFMREYMRMNPLEGKQKYAVVTHSQFMATLTAEGADPSDSKGLKGYTWAENCQLLPYNRF